MIVAKVSQALKRKADMFGKYRVTAQSDLSSDIYKTLKQTMFYLKWKILAKESNNYGTPHQSLLARNDYDLPKD